MARHVEHIALLVVLETLGTQGDALVEGDMVADDAGFADDDTCAMIDGEVLTDLSSGVDVDTSLGVSLLRDDTGYDRHLHLVEPVGDAVVNHGVDHGIAEDDLAIGLGSRIVVEHGLYVGIEQTLDFRKGVDELQGQPLADT